MRFLGRVVVAAAVVVAACGASEPAPSARNGDLVDEAQLVPAAVTTKAAMVADAAGTRDAATVAALAGTGFEFDFERPEITFAQHLEGAASAGLLGQLEVVAMSAPGRRLSPFGNGTVQELWVFPAIALEVATEWTDAEIEHGMGAGFLTAATLAEYQAADAYLGFSIGFSPEGEWVFFTDGRVGWTPPTPR